MRVEIPIRDEKGQAIIEYILVLVVSVSIILGALYQLNDAFKAWATNYFGTYIACLLETGELPSISGTGGDSGLCNQFFAPFSLANGRPLLAKAANEGNDGKKQNSSAAAEKTPGNRVGGGGGSGGNSGWGEGSHSGQNGSGGGSGGGKKDEPTYTGDTKATSYGSYGNYNNSSRKTRVTLDTAFAMQTERERFTRRQITSVPQKNYTGSAGQKTAVHFTNKASSDAGDAPGSGFTIANFIRYLIIAAIVLAVVIFLGGQGLQIGKGMD